MSKEKTDNFMYGEILIIEDNTSDLKFISELLTEAGYRIRPATNGKLALRSIQAKTPDLILLDMNLPDISGVEICRKIKQNPDMNNVPVIFISATTKIDLKVKALEAGGIDYITKPIDPSEVLARIRTHLKMYQLQQKLTAQSEELIKEIKIRKQIDKKLEDYHKNLEKLIEERTETLKKEIIERKQAETKLLKSEEKFKAFTNQANEGITVADMDGNYIFVNPAFCKMSGYSEKELLNMTVFDMKAKGQSHSAFYDSKKKLEGVPLHVNLERKDKTTYVTEITGKVITIDNEKLVLGTIRNITERMESEKVNRNQAKLLDLIFEHSLDSIVLLDKDYNFIRVSNAYAKACGKELYEFKGHNHFEFYPSNLKDEFDVCKKEKKIYMTLSRPFEFPDYPEWGVTYWDLGLVPIMDIEEETKLFLFTLKDVTKNVITENKRKELQNQLIQSQKMESIGTLAGGIAHDFNNILGVIMGYTELTLDDLTDKQTIINNLMRVMKASNRAKEMVQQILTFSRKGEQNMESVNIGKIIKETYNFLRSSIPTTIEITHSIENNLGLILGNSTQINQVLMNLCTNATHAMKKKGGLLKISLKEVVFDLNDSDEINLEPGRYQQLIVSDTGHGISKEIIDHIFEPYFTTKKEGEGTGMGLAVIYGIIKSHKGDIKVHSEWEKGTAFNIYFPVLDPFKLEKSDLIQKTIIRGNNEVILFVDDELHLADLGTQMLKSLGYRTESRVSSIEALKAFKFNPDKYDLIITDMTMPNMTGVKLAGEIHKIKPDIPIIICTGFSDIINKNNFEAMGINALIMKPIIKKELGEAIQRVLIKE